MCRGVLQRHVQELPVRQLPTSGHPGEGKRPGFDSSYNQKAGLFYNLQLDINFLIVRTAQLFGGIWLVNSILGC